MKCDKCGKEFEGGNRPDGIPNGVVIIREDGTQVTMCSECIIEMGKEIVFGNRNEAD